MIDHARETLLSFAQAAKRLPHRGDGKPCHPNTVARWAREGLGSVILESIRIGGRRYTSVEACQRFFEALTSGDEVDSHHGPSDSQRLAAGEAGLKLDALWGSHTRRRPEAS